MLVFNNWKFRNSKTKKKSKVYFRGMFNFSVAEKKLCKIESFPFLDNFLSESNLFPCQYLIHGMPQRWLCIYYPTVQNFVNGRLYCLTATAHISDSIIAKKNANISILVWKKARQLAEIKMPIVWTTISFEAVRNVVLKSNEWCVTYDIILTELWLAVHPFIKKKHLIWIHNDVISLHVRFEDLAF